MDVTYDGKDHNELSPNVGVSREESAPHVEHAYAGFLDQAVCFLLDGVVIGSINNLAVFTRFQPAEPP